MCKTSTPSVPSQKERRPSRASARISKSGSKMQREEERDEDEIVCLGESFFIDRDYQLTTFNFGPHVLNLLCLHSASTDYDLTGQIVWPGAVLLNNYLSQNAEILEERSVIELGSGVGITGILCSRFCHKVVLTDHNEEVLEILKKNIELQSSSRNLSCGDNAGIPLLFETVESILRFRSGQCTFILAYVSRAKVMDVMVIDEAVHHGMDVKEVKDTRSIISNLEGVIFEITLKQTSEL
ncbi:hypothetical protein J5N97_013454 [Dioscorea zingiberensis]|uniref:Protein N-lysine methyltransferase METTL21A n=1 Tax=Dioscorea zingiberensis TaxID=325984 RepID=A0A9D5CTC5_9LILI|nr:hypothetical protein J5N97_013454 [Dioscorea zingiberensis]